MVDIPTVTLADAQRMIHEVIAEHPDADYDHIYADTLNSITGVSVDDPEFIEPGDDTECMNWVARPDGERIPLCLVGQVFAKVGVLDAFHSDSQSRGLTLPNEESPLVGEWWREYIDLTPDARRYLYALQRAQDEECDRPWADIVRAIEDTDG